MNYDNSLGYNSPLNYDLNRFELDLVSLRKTEEKKEEYPYTLISLQNNYILINDENQYDRGFRLDIRRD
jgi:hypothetical protein